MASPIEFVRRWITTVVTWCLMIAAAVACGIYLQGLAAWGAWAGFAAVVCAFGALLIASQPLGRATLAGRIGYQVVHFGFRASQGQLKGAALISFAVWLVIGSAAIWTVMGGWQPLRAAMALTWTIDILGIFYIFGIALRDRPRVDSGEASRVPLRLPNSLAKVAAGLAVLIAISAGLWWLMGTPAAQLAALLLAAGPLVVIGGGYGLMLAVMLTAGKNARWN
jgi:hypothetical protein